MSDQRWQFTIREFSRDVRRYRAENSLTLRKAAPRIGISYATLSRVERGNRMEVEVFLKLCHWIGENPINYLQVKP